MRTESTETLCPLCGEDPRPESENALIAEWVCELLGLEDYESRMIWCTACGSSFFSYRYTQKEMALLYSGYRSENYYRARYGANANEVRLEEEQMRPQWNHARGEQLSSLLQAFLTPPSSFDIAIDLGGGTGDLIPQEVPQRLVLDLSTQKLNEGVTRLENIGELCASIRNVGRNSRVLLMLIGVLEHVPCPDVLLSDAVEQLFKNESVSEIVAMLQVPHGVPKSLQKTTPEEREFGRLLIQSEHLNFLSEEGLEALVFKSLNRFQVKVSKAVAQVPSGSLQDKLAVRQSLNMHLEIWRQHEQ